MKSADELADAFSNMYVDDIAIEIAKRDAEILHSALTEAAELAKGHTESITGKTIAEEIIALRDNHP